MTDRAFDAAVVGGGIVGRIAAIATARAGLRTLHLAPPAPPDRRTSALMQPSIAALAALGILSDPAAHGHPLRQIRIIDATQRLLRAPETLFDCAAAGLEAFGWNFPNTALAQACEAVAATLPGLVTSARTATRLGLGEAGATLSLDDGATVEVPLVVGADGRRSMTRGAAGIAVREHEFAEAALVCDLTLGRSLGAQSVEFHYDRGPFTLVPAGGQRANLVWIDDRAVLDAVRSGGNGALQDAMASRSMRLFGAIELEGPAAIFPLGSLAVARAGARGVVLVGEAAHAFPPIGAQGLNLGLRDVADLSAVLAEADRTATGWGVAASEVYGHRRAADLARTGFMVDALFGSLLSAALPAQAARAGGLWALNRVPGLRQRAFGLGMGTPAAPQ
jgi:2-octaprenyl-6-methoxyphenol hydroxylase